MTYNVYHIIISNPGHTRSKQQFDKYWIKTFVSPSKILSTRRKRKRQEVGDDLSVCVLNILPKVSAAYVT